MGHNEALHNNLTTALWSILQSPCTWERLIHFCMQWQAHCSPALETQRQKGSLSRNGQTSFERIVLKDSLVYYSLVLVMSLKAMHDWTTSQDPKVRTPTRARNSSSGVISTLQCRIQIHHLNTKASIFLLPDTAASITLHSSWWTEGNGPQAYQVNDSHVLMHLLFFPSGPDVLNFWGFVVVDQLSITV